jgi:hypothetical protein
VFLDHCHRTGNLGHAPPDRGRFRPQLPPVLRRRCSSWHLTRVPGRGTPKPGGPSERGWLARISPPRLDPSRAGPLSEQRTSGRS